MADIWANMLDGFKEILLAPFKDLSILWLLLPVILFWLILEIYFGRYKKERLGWNTALGNGLSLFWVVVISFRALFEKSLELFSISKLIFAIFISVYSVFIISISFTHKLKEKIFFLFASPTIVYYLSGIAILWIHGLITMSFWVVIDLVILYIIILILETILKMIIPASSRVGEDSKVGAGLDTGLGDIGKGFGKL